MKLKNIIIESYKNLEGSYSFYSNGYIALIGLNGSGKSNLLEAISIIFDNLINKHGSSIPFDYTIEYEIKGHTYSRKKNEAKKDGIKCRTEEMEFPSSIIACYSGEDLRLWHTAFERYHMGYFNKSVNQAYSSPKFLYVNKYCWKIALIALVCSNDSEVKSFLSKTLKINSSQDIIIDFEIDNAKKNIFKAHTALQWFNRITLESINEINLNTIATTDIYVTGKQIPDNDKAKYIFDYLYLLSMPQKNRKNRIDKLIENIKIRLNTNGIIIDFEDLSEGEKKLILIECITKVLGDKDSLVLLDEPDAHTHIAMKKDLLKLISEFEGQTVMTTHSPMFLNKRWEGYDDKNIYYMNDGQIENTEPLQHLAELTGNEIDYFEGSFILSSKRILVTEGPYDILYIKYAIDKLSADNQSYLKIKEQVAFLHAGGSDNAVDLYNQTLYPSRSHYEHLVFLFDYDKAGFDGAEKVKKAINNNEDTKPIILFYQDDYSTEKVKKPNDKDPDSYIVEDLFDSKSYNAVTNIIHVNSHKELRNITWNGVISGNKRPKATTEAIKYYIQENYKSFEKDWLLNFKPVLDKLLEVFQLY